MRLFSSLAAIAALAAAVACGAPNVDGTALMGDSDPLPARSNHTGDDDDATQPTTGTTTSASTTTHATTTSADAGSTAPPASKACTVADAEVCFTFEGNVQDQVTGGVQPTVATGVTFVPGHENEAISFTADSAVEFAADPSFELPAHAGTIEAWIKREDTAANAVVFDDDGRFSATILPAGHLQCATSGGAAKSTIVVQANVWQHVACVVDTDGLHIYVNGVADVQAAGSIGSAPTLTASLGANAPPGSAEGDQKFIGLIDSFRLLDVARAATDIAADAAGTND